MGIDNIASQCSNKRMMILKYDRKIRIEGEYDDEDVTDVKYSVDRELLVIIRALSVEKIRFKGI